MPPPQQLENETAVIYKPGLWSVVAEFGGSVARFKFAVLPEEGEQPPENITITANLTTSRIYGDQADLCRENIKKAFALLKRKAPLYYDYVMNIGESVSCNS
jgi:hypothetical protein